MLWMFNEKELDNIQYGLLCAIVERNEDAEEAKKEGNTAMVEVHENIGDEYRELNNDITAMRKGGF